MPYWWIKKYTLDDLRAHDHHPRPIQRAPTFPNAGWHFTNMGGEEFIKRKLGSYSHQEFNHPTITDQLEQKIKENKDFIGRDFKFWLDESELPKYILDNRKRYEQLLALNVRES